MIDTTKLRTFFDKLEWEGGLVEIVNYGLTDTGDNQLNFLLNNLKEALHKAEKRAYALELILDDLEDSQEEDEDNSVDFENIESEEYDEGGEDIDYDDLEPYGDEPH